MHIHKPSPYITTESKFQQKPDFVTDYRTLRVQTANFLHNHSRPMRRRFMVVTEHRVVWDLIMPLSLEKDVLTHWLMKRGELVTIGLPPTVATVFCNTIQEMEILWTTPYLKRTPILKITQELIKSTTLSQHKMVKFIEALRGYYY